jgi:TRAP-type C4-dicarboxylate transport system substrate-binding protein
MSVARYAITLGALALSTNGLAEPVQLKFVSPSPPQSLITNWGLTPWIEEVQKAADGTIDIKSFAGSNLGNFNNILDRTLNGVVEISWGILGPYSDQFPQTDVASIPFVADQGRASSVALWRLMTQGVIRDDWAKVKVLGLFNFPPAGFHANNPIRTLDDLKGLKLAVSVRNLGELIELLGAAPVTMQPTEIYQSAQRGVTNGIAMAWPAFYPFKFHEVTKFHIDGSFGGTPSFVIMNKDAYDKLPGKAKETFDRLGGERLSEHMGTTTDRMNEDGRVRVQNMGGHTLVKLDPKEEPAWKQRAQPILDKWLKSTPNGARVLDAYRTEYANALKAQ